MSSDNPPYPYYDGIPFNPSFFSTDTGGLSQATANNLYLRKTVADTATAQETFNAGIKTTKVDGLVPATTLYVGNNITTGSVILGNLSCRTKSAGTFETLSIRTPTTNGSLTICTDLTLNGSVDIGTVQSQTFLYGTTRTNTIEGVVTTGDQSFFTTKTADNLNVFSSSGSTAILNVKGSGIKFDSLSTDNPTGNQSLYSNKTAGSVSIMTIGTGLLQVNGAGISINYPVNNTTFATIGSYKITDYNGGATNYNLTSSLSFSQISIALPIGIYQCTAKCNIKTPSSSPFFNVYFYLSDTVLSNGSLQIGGFSAQSWGGQVDGFKFGVVNQEVPINFSAPVVVSSATVNRLSVVCYSDQTVCNVRVICSAVRIG